MEQPHLNLSDLEKANRRKFVNEYLIDYDAIAACKRMGYHNQHAIMYSKDFLDCSYVSKLITDKEFSLAENTEESIAEQRRRLRVALWREANHRGYEAKHAARVQALGIIKTILYKDDEKKNDNVADLFSELIDKVTNG